jgi:hypothetical protein
MESTEASLTKRLLAGTVHFNGMTATAAIHRCLRSIDEPERPVFWGSREIDIVALLAGTSARGVARPRAYQEWLSLENYVRLSGRDRRPDIAFDHFHFSETVNLALRDGRDWQVVAAHLIGAGVPSHMCDDTAMIAEEGVAAHVLLQALPCESAQKLGKRLDRMIAVRDVASAGVWAMWLTGANVVAMPRPVVQRRDREAHAEDGPAIKFPGGMAIYAWNGGYVPEPWVIEQPWRITPETIIECRDGRVGNVALERYGFERFIVSPESELVSDEPGIGRLFRRSVRWDFAVFAAVEVINSTPEPDGSHRRHVLAVPAHMSTAREAVAWTFGLGAHEYRPDAET